MAPPTWPFISLIFFLTAQILGTAADADVEASSQRAANSARKAERIAALKARQAEALAELNSIDVELGEEPAEGEGDDSEDEGKEDADDEGSERAGSVRMDTEGMRAPHVTKEASCKAANVCGRFVKHNPCQCTEKCKHYGNCCPDFEKVCNGYQPHNPDLLSPSPAPLYTFYMYRAQSDVSYPPLNANMASLSGVLWYLQNEVVNRCNSGGHAGGRGGGEYGYRRFKISRILRYKVQTRATTPLFKAGMNFGSRVAFDFGKNTGAFEPWQDMKYNYGHFGYNVGCSTLGSTESSPYPKCPSNEGTSEHFCPVKYPDAYWYSMPGQCPEQDIKHKTAKCQSRSPGGYCKGTPTGQGNCTWTYEDAGEIDIDELVGIKEKYGTHYKFCKKGCMEYVKYGNKYTRDQGKCVNFWDHRMDTAKNQERMDKADALFKKKYPNMVSEKEMKPPKCDFHKQTFYHTLKSHHR
eukprot:TRINITY_DN285_c0_g1_i1.p1 TRINITY_DN285_c0_g1~~TRINITY_DN285_c0_g1_i1.p1  ORF type:complete len:466 (+),score=112.16 TRINITY_DN285_c0_g1_i1:53-1450(+)